jgi:hypothetical protein
VTLKIDLGGLCDFKEETVRRKRLMILTNEIKRRCTERLYHLALRGGVAEGGRQE